VALSAQLAASGRQWTAVCSRRLRNNKNSGLPNARVRTRRPFEIEASLDTRATNLAAPNIIKLPDPNECNIRVYFISRAANSFSREASGATKQTTPASQATEIASLAAAEWLSKSLGGEYTPQILRPGQLDTRRFAPKHNVRNVGPTRYTGIFLAGLSRTMPARDRRRDWKPSTCDFCRLIGLQKTKVSPALYKVVEVDRTNHQNSI
jgi:hypothetical protein